MGIFRHSKIDGSRHIREIEQRSIEIDKTLSWIYLLHSRFLFLNEFSMKLSVQKISYSEFQSFFLMIRHSSTWFQICNWRARQLDWIRIDSKSARMCSNRTMWFGLPKRLLRAGSTERNLRKAARVSYKAEEARDDSRTIRSIWCVGYTLKVID